LLGDGCIHRSVGGGGGVAIICPGQRRCRRWRGSCVTGVVIRYVGDVVGSGSIIGVRVGVICNQEVSLEVGGGGIVGDSKHWPLCKKSWVILVNINTLSFEIRRAKPLINDHWSYNWSQNQNLAEFYRDAASRNKKVFDKGIMSSRIAINSRMQKMPSPSLHQDIK
jgi:hypothetical protein